MVQVMVVGKLGLTVLVLCRVLCRVRGSGECGRSTGKCSRGDADIAGIAVARPAAHGLDLPLWQAYGSGGSGSTNPE